MNTLRCAVDRIVWGGVILILVVAPTQYSLEIAGGINLSLVDPLVWLVGGLWFFRLLLDKQVAWVRSVPLVTLLFLLMGAASIVRADNRLAVVKDLFQWIEYFAVAFLLFASALDRRLSMRAACYIFFAVGTVIVGWAVVEYVMPAVAEFDISGPFGNRNVLGGFLSLLLPLMFGWLLWDRNWARRAWLGIVILAGLAVTLSGGSLLAILLAGGILSMVRGQAIFVGYVVAVVLMLGLGLAVLPRENVWPLHDSIAIFEADGSAAQRYPEWQAALIMAEENPFLGVGAGNYQEHIGMYYGTLPSIAKKAEADSQNMYLVLASSIGLPGLLFFVGMLLYFIRLGCRGLQASADPWVKGMAAGSIGALIGFSINCIWAPLLVRGIGVPLVFVMALACIAGQSRHESNG